MRALLVGIMIGLSSSSILFASEAQRLRLQIGHVSSPLELTGTVGLGADNALGARIAYERLFTERFGLEVGLASSQHDLTLVIVNGVPRTSSFRMSPLTLSGTLHVGASNRVDSFFGAGLAYVTVSDYTPAGSSESISVNSELTWTVQYGMDIALGRKQRLSAKRKRWSLGLSVSYMQGEADAGSLSLPLETVNISAGVVWQLR